MPSIAIRRSLSLLTAAALATGMATVAVAPAGATPPSIPWAYSQFLTGTAGSLDLSTLSGVAGLGASYPSLPSPTPLPIDTSTLNGLSTTLPGGLPLFGLNGVLNLGSGVLNQVASAASNGDLLAATGAVNDLGVPDLGGLGTPTSIDATGLLSQVPAVSSALSQLKVTLDGIASTATESGGIPTGTSNLSGGVLTMSSPIVSGIPSSVLSALSPVQSAVNALAGSSGGLAQAVNGIPVVGTVLSALGLSSATSTVTVGGGNLASTVSPLMSGVLHSSDGFVGLDPSTGVINADLAGLLGGDLSSLPVGTDLLSSSVLGTISGDVSSIVDQLMSDVEDAVSSAIGSAPVSLQSTAGSLLGTGLNITTTGTINQILGGTAATSEVLSVLGIPLTLLPSGLLSALSGPINTSVINGVLPDFGTSLLDQIGTPTTGSLVPGLDSLSSVLGMTANVQSLVSGLFSQTALLTTLLPGLNPLALLGLGSSSVGTIPLAAPTAATISPARGPSAGGQQVTVTGANFVPGLTTVHIGGKTVNASGSGTTALTFTTPSHVAGSNTVTVETPAGTTSALNYRFFARPTAGALHPASGPQRGGRLLTITGSGFVKNATTVKIGGKTVAAGKVTVVSSTRLSIRTPAHAAGSASISVKTPGGTSTGRSYVFRAAPRLTGVSRAKGSRSGGQVVTLTGSRFVRGDTAVRIGGTTLRASEVTVVSNSKLRFTTPAHASGRVTISVITAGGSSGTKSFRYVAGSAIKPLMRSISMSQVPTTAGGERLVIVGSGFVPGSTSVRFGRTTVGASAVTVVSPTKLWLLIPAHAAGSVPFQTITAGHGSQVATLPYQQPSAAPSAVVRVTSPRAGVTTGSSAPFISGKGRAGATVRVLVDGVAYCSAHVGAGGNWSCAGITPLLAGKHAVRASQTVTGHSPSRLTNALLINVT